MPIKVSVVVPVFNPGEHIATSIDSLLAQTMPADELELIFVDDGSTDDTPTRLDRLAEQHSQVRVIHEPASGWAGRPRNVGLDEATGEYVLFVDQDDWLGEEALSRMYAMARRNHSDIVIGKMVGVGRGVPVQLFRKSLDTATIHDSAIIDSLTPHKMFRREFLLESKLRFPEGPRRLEDHVFVVAAYFAASRISVLSDYACYYHVSRGDRGNAGFRPLDPPSYLAYLAEAIDVVDANTDPGPARDRLHRRWLRVELVGRLRGAKLLGASEDFREKFFRESRAFVQDRFAEGVDAGLLPMERLVVWLLRAGELPALVALAEWERELTLQARLSSAYWQDGALTLDVSTVLVDGEGNPVELQDLDGARLLVPPLPPAVLEGVPPELLDVGEGTTSLELFAQHTETSAQRFLSSSSTSDDGAEMRATATASLPLSERAGDPEPLIDGAWEIFARWRAFGWTSSRRVIAAAPAAGTRNPFGGRGLVGAEPRLAAARRTPRGHLRVELTTVSRADPTTGPTIQVDRTRSTASGRRAGLTLDLTLQLATDRTRDVTVRVSSGSTAPGQAWPATLEPAAAGDGRNTACRLSATVAHPHLAAGSWKLHLSPGSTDDTLPIASRLLVRRSGAARLSDHPAPTYRARVLALLPPQVAQALRSLRRRVAAR